ncbi:ATP-dependent nuclease [Achromobacter aegrifaciens]|uniref:Predicted ATP-binding protein involved in virulence n=1 Tax=Achromobacter aegrifaciens TaxID=1287736 RepID=A0AAD2J199_ACHAE|nr:AAA family ATPase [Achromobacter aegrifaciens]CUJ32602.1 Predicted ATP-binding protein involved in virulence [Achromobacter aegrifaciens]
MNKETTSEIPPWPLRVKYCLVGDQDTEAVIEIRPGITTLVGPNGSGKTRSLREIKSKLIGVNSIGAQRRKVHFLSAGRSSPFESFRARSNQPDFVDSSDAAIGHSRYIDQWWDYESVTGDLIVLDSRPDLKLKVEARLQQLFDRSVELKWTQGGMAMRITSVTGGDGYAANYEASGILQLVALLSAIHNDDIGALLIDEPEISLHPQHQAFVLEEMEQVAGDPSDPKKKLIVMATHSASMLPLRRIDELPKIVFFTSVQQAPAQVASDASILKRAKLAALVARLGTTHRTAMFAEHILLVEGPSDETVTSQLARKLGLRLLARNAQILPVAGKGEFVEAAKLFRLMRKRVALLADLDALADDNALVSSFSELPEAAAVADGLGRKSLADLDRDLRDALSAFISGHITETDAAAETYPDWSSKESRALTKQRVTLARILSDPASFGGNAGVKAASLCTQYEVLLSALGVLGCFFLRRGAIENYYDVGEPTNNGKPDRAAIEAAGFDAKEASELIAQYDDVHAALLHAAPNQLVDEDLLLRMKLGAILTPVLLGMKTESSDIQLDAIARNTIGADATVFKLKNRSTSRQLRIEVDIASPLFERATFPFQISPSDNPTTIVPAVLPGIPKET